MRTLLLLLALICSVAYGATEVLIDPIFIDVPSELAPDIEEGKPMSMETEVYNEETKEYDKTLKIDYTYEDDRLSKLFFSEYADGKWTLRRVAEVDYDGELRTAITTYYTDESGEKKGDVQEKINYEYKDGMIKEIISWLYDDDAETLSKRFHRLFTYADSQIASTFDTLVMSPDTIVTQESEYTYEGKKVSSIACKLTLNAFISDLEFEKKQISYNNSKLEKIDYFFKSDGKSWDDEPKSLLEYKFNSAGRVTSVLFDYDFSLLGKEIIKRKEKRTYQYTNVALKHAFPVAKSVAATLRQHQNSICFSLKNSGTVSVRLYDLSGKMLSTMINSKEMFSGSHSVALPHTAHLSKQTCICVLDIDGVTVTSRILMP